MKKVLFKLWITLPFCFFLFAFTQVQAQGKIQTSILYPPSSVLEDIGTVAVMNFNNTSSYHEQNVGVKMADYLIEALLQDSRGKSGNCYLEGGYTNAYKVIDRNNLNTIMAELNLNVSDVVDESQAVEVGKLLGVEAIILGNVTYSYKDEKTSSSTKNEKTGKTTYSYCIKRTVSSEARVRVISVGTGEIIETFSPVGSHSDRKCSSKGYQTDKLATVQVLATRSLRNLAGRIASSITPSYRSFTLKTEKITLKSIKAKAKEANGHIKKNELDLAYPLYEAIYAADNYNPAAAFNLGLVYEVAGDFAKAKEYYEIAYQLDQKEKSHAQAYKRIGEHLNALEVLEAMGIEQTPYEFMEHIGGTNDALSDKVTIKGNRSIRAVIRAEANASSDEVAQIPGGVELVVNGEPSGDWIPVKLLGGKSGYINKNDVK